MSRKKQLARLRRKQKEGDNMAAKYVSKSVAVNKQTGRLKKGFKYVRGGKIIRC